MWNYSERPAKADVKRLIVDGEPKTVYEVGKYLVTVPGSETEVTYHCPRYGMETDPRKTFPNMEVCDGEIKIPVADLVDEVLSRVQPVELAQALWSNEDAKAEFMYCLVTSYNEQGIDDADRRKFLAGVKEAVHCKSIDDLARRMASVEFEYNRHANYYDQVRRINNRLRELDVKVLRSVKGENGEWRQEAVLLQFDSRDTSWKDESGNFLRGELEVGGKSWEEAREFWRTEILKKFSLPQKEKAKEKAEVCF